MNYLNANKTQNCFVLILTLFFTISASAQIPAGYYDDAVGKTGANLKSSLNGIISGHTTYPYTSSNTDVWDILKEADKDPNNASNVIGIYSGFSMDADAEYASGSGWSREHVWAKSRGDFGTSQGPGTDCHHIVAEDISTNSARNNRNFDYGDSFYTDASGTYSGATLSKTSSDWIWEPRDSKKGDVARMIFYMATRYEGVGGEPDLELTETLLSSSDMSPVHGKLSVLLEWHLNDPVSSEEQARNEVIYSYQNNRNPFIDHPEYVCEIWTCPVPNNAPTFTSTASTTANTSAAYNYSITTNDSDADALTILATTKPSWLSFTDNGDGTASLSGTPAVSDVGDNDVVLSVSDGTDTETQSFTIVVSSAGGSSGGSGTASDLFISEYIEGSSFNKGVEIANYTGAAVDLSDYSLFKQTNGSGAWGSELDLTGTLNNNDVYVIVHSSAHADMQAQADVSISSGAVTFNGNDPIALFKSGVLIDVVGTFNVTSNFAKDKTLVRKSTVSAPNTTYTTGEWDEFSSNEFSYLGSHTFDAATLYTEIITPSSVSITTGDEASGFLIGHLIDDSGLSATPTPTNFTSITSTESSSDVWATSSPNGAAPALYFDNSIADPVIEFGLPEMSIINSFIAWGYSGSNSSGVAAGTLEFSTDGGTTYGKAYNFSIGTTILDPSSGGYEMLGGLHVIANYVRLTITENHKTLGASVSGGDQVGLGEVKFIGETFDINYNGLWSGGSGGSGSPDNTDTERNLIITNGSPTLSTDVTTRYLSIQDGASLTIDPNVTITVSEETIINGAGALILKSDATGTANFIDNGFVYDYAGSATVERYIDDMDLSFPSYHYISSPINNHPKFTDMLDLYGYSEASLEWIHANSFTNFTNMSGYAIRYETTTTKSFTGEFNTGDQSLAVTTTSNGGSEFEGKNLLGNPYPSAISADSLIDHNDHLLNPTLYFWNGLDYSIYNTAINSGTAGALGATPDGHIAVGQAFFVDAHTTGTVSLNNSMRTQDSNLFFKKKSTPQLRLMVHSSNGRSECLLNEHKASTFGNDQYDSEHLVGNANVNVSVWQGGRAYDIQSIPEITNSTFDLQVSTETAQELNFSLKDLVALDGYRILLEDRENGVLTDLSETTYATYLASGIENNRFKLRIVKKEQPVYAYVNNGRLVIYGETAQTPEARLISIDGKQVATSVDMQFQNWDRLAEGIYLLEIILENNRFTQKIMK